MDRTIPFILNRSRGLGLNNLNDHCILFIFKWTRTKQVYRISKPGRPPSFLFTLDVITTPSWFSPPSSTYPLVPLFQYPHISLVSFFYNSSSYTDTVSWSTLDTLLIITPPAVALNDPELFIGIGAYPLPLTFGRCTFCCVVFPFVD